MPRIASSQLGERHGMDSPESILPALWLWNFGLQNCERINLSVLSHPVYGNLLQQLLETNTSAIPNMLRGLGFFVWYFCFFSFVNGCWILSGTFSVSIDMLFFFKLACWYERLHWMIFEYWTSLAYLKSHLGRIPFKHRGIQFASVFLRDFEFKFMRDIGL